MAAIKTCKETGREYIQFKTTNPTGCKDSIAYMCKVLKKVMQESMDFTNVDITTVFRRPNGEFKLYGRHYFANTEGDVFYWTGVDTENWMGWSLRIVKLDDAASQAAFATPDIKFLI